MKKNEQTTKKHEKLPRMQRVKLTASVDATFRLCLQYGASKHNSCVPKLTETPGSGGFANRLRFPVPELASFIFVNIIVPYRVA